MKGVLLDLILVNEEGFTEDAKVEGSFGCSDQEMVELRILRDPEGKRESKNVGYYSKLTSSKYS